MKKVRVLYPTGLAGTKHSDAVGGSVHTMDDDEAEAFIAARVVEPADATVEQATAAPGEKRTTVRRPKAR